MANLWKMGEEKAHGVIVLWYELRPEQCTLGRIPVREESGSLPRTTYMIKGKSNGDLAD